MCEEIVANEESADLSGWGGPRRGGGGLARRDAHAAHESSLEPESPPPSRRHRATSRSARGRSSSRAVASAMLNVAYGLISAHRVGVTSPAPERMEMT